MKKLIIANWKMNLSVRQSLDFIKKIVKSNNEIVIAAPFTFLGEMLKRLKTKSFQLAAQNVSQFAEGAYTGEVSAKMLKEAGCVYGLVGHSERRIYFKETDQDINQKILQLLNNSIKPVLCVGENYLEQQKKLTNKILQKQLQIALKDVADISKVVIAYEPVWAISTFQKGKTKRAADLQDICAAHLYIKTVIQRIYGKNKTCKVIYGGTVKPENSAAILGLPCVDGALVGGASLKISSFNAIIQSTK